jgi:hypothetical protein
MLNRLLYAWVVGCAFSAFVENVQQVYLEDAAEAPTKFELKASSADPGQLQWDAATKTITLKGVTEASFAAFQHDTIHSDANYIEAKLAAGQDLAEAAAVVDDFLAPHPAWHVASEPYAWQEGDQKADSFILHRTDDQYELELADTLMKRQWPAKEDCRSVGRFSRPSQRLRATAHSLYTAPATVLTSPPPRNQSLRNASRPLLEPAASRSAETAGSTT